ncbi:hypothetical protein C4572_03625 [Candidatus Parcubacteria bacterium]|nr:MAG: hypothetical protein C4572_03625 [Candidatus Parcubacteria bacterium]
MMTKLLGFWNWIIWLWAAGWIFKAAIIIVGVLILGLLIFAMLKTPRPGRITFGAKLVTKKRIILALILGFIGLIVLNNLPQIRLARKVKKVERNLTEKALKPLEKRADELAEKVETGEGLTLNEARELQDLKKEITATKKLVKEGPPSPPKPAKLKPPKPVKWIFQIRADPEVVMQAGLRGVDQVPFREFEAVSVSIKEKEIRFSYKRNSKKRNVLLTRESSDQFYFGMVDLGEGIKMQLWLKESPEGFAGMAENWDGKHWYPKVSALLLKS